MRISHLFVFAILGVLIGTSLAGCGKSADELYNEGKTLIGDEKTYENGIKTFHTFEKKFPNDPRTPEVMLSIATFYQIHNKNDEAVNQFKRLIETYPASPETYKGKFLLGYMYYDILNNKEKAMNVLQNFITDYPDSELALSAKVIVENIDLPVEEWSMVKEMGLTEIQDNTSSP